MKYLKFLGRLPYKRRTFCQKPPAECDKVDPIIMIHGGAGPIFDNLIIPKTEAVKKAAEIGYKALLKGGAADGVEQALRFMESSGHFNTGRGSNLNEEGFVELDAIIMTGNLDFGSVYCVRDIEHPITLARMIMDKTPQTSMSSTGAIKFAKSQNMEILPSGKLVCERAQKLLKETKLYDGREVGVAGIVALDRNGNMAAGTSSGGQNGKALGSSGDCCLPGCCSYADNSIGAVTVTGDSAPILKTCLAYSVLDNIQDGLSTSEAIQKSLFMMDMRMQGVGGAIAISKDGDAAFYFNTKRMPWAYHTISKIHYGIDRGEHNTEPAKL